MASKKKIKSVSFRVSDDVLKVIDAAAKSLGFTRSKLIRKAIEKYLEIYFDIELGEMRGGMKKKKVKIEV